MRKKKKGIGDHFIKLDYPLLESASWTSLSFQACWVYIQLKKQFKGDDSKLILPYTKVRKQMSRLVFYRSIQELVDNGLIRRVSQGGLVPRRPTVYALTEAWKRISVEIVEISGDWALKQGIAKSQYAKKARSAEHFKKNLRQYRKAD